MKKNKVQFQHGESLFSFINRLGNDSQCREIIFKIRWPNGFKCPECGAQTYCFLQKRHLYQCNECHYQTSLIANTLFEATKLPLKIWFLGIYLVSQSKGGISTLHLARQLGISQNSAWLMKHKLMQTMLERENSSQLNGRVEVDDAYWGGKQSGGKRGRGASGKYPFIIAVETTEEYHPIHIKCSAVNGFRKQTIKDWAKKLLSVGSHVISDGLNAFNGIDAADIKHTVIVTGGGAASMEIIALQWVNTILGNLKNSFRGAYHKICDKHLPRYLAEFSYRFNNRFELDKIADQLIRDVINTPPFPGWMVKLAEVAW